MVTQRLAPRSVPAALRSPSMPLMTRGAGTTAPAIPAAMVSARVSSVTTPLALSMRTLQESVVGRADTQRIAPHLRQADPARGGLPVAVTRVRPPGRSGATPPTFGALARSCEHLPQRSPLALDDRRWPPDLLGWVNRSLYLNPESVEGGEQGAVLLPDRPVRARLLEQELGKLVAPTVQLGQLPVDLRPRIVLGLGAGRHSGHVSDGVRRRLEHLCEQAADLFVVHGLCLFAGHEVGSVKEGTAQVPDGDVGVLEPRQPGPQPRLCLAGLGTPRVEPGTLLGARQGPVGVRNIVTEAPGIVQHPVGRLTGPPCTQLVGELPEECRHPLGQLTERVTRRLHVERCCDYRVDDHTDPGSDQRLVDAGEGRPFCAPYGQHVHGGDRDLEQLGAQAQDTADDQ